MSSHVCCAASRRSVLSQGSSSVPRYSNHIGKKICVQVDFVPLGPGISSFVNFEPLHKEPCPDVGLVCTEMVRYCTIEVRWSGESRSELNIYLPLYRWAGLDRSEAGRWPHHHRPKN